MQHYEGLRLGECRISKRSHVFPVRYIVYIKYSINTFSHNIDKRKQLKKQLKNEFCGGFFVCFLSVGMYHLL